MNYYLDDDRVVGMILGGSLTRGSADSYSDVDLYIVARDGSFDAVFDERDVAALAIGSPLFSFDVEWTDRQVLKDDSGSLGAVISRSAMSRPDRPEPEILTVLNQRFWTWSWYVFGKIMRGELWEALEGIHTIRSDVLLPLLDWTSGRPHEGYRRLERKLDSEMAARLAATVTPLEAGTLYEALQTAIAMYCELRESLFDRCGATSDTASEEVVRGEMSRRWAARGA